LDFTIHSEKRVELIGNVRILRQYRPQNNKRAGWWLSRLERSCGLFTSGESLKRLRKGGPIQTAFLFAAERFEQEKLETRKMLENAPESHTSGTRFVGTLLT